MPDPARPHTRATRQLLGASVVPTATAFWDLREGDTVLEFAVKAKRGALGNTLDLHSMRRLLGKLLSLMPNSAREKQKVVAQVGRPPEPTWRARPSRRPPAAQAIIASPPQRRASRPLVKALERCAEAMKPPPPHIW